jgi:branched-chain amino acid transport system ATP-binding protein
MSDSSVLLQAQSISRRFGGLVANENVSISLRRGQIHTLLGPNGAGKSTFINMLSGDLRPSAGAIFFGQTDITNFSANERSLIGIGRSYQRTNIFAQFTVFENCRLAAQSRKQRATSIFSRADSFSDYAESVRSALREAGLEGKERVIASQLSHGEQRQLEIAMVLATNAQVLLLDEPLAGMGSDEAQHMARLLNQLKQTKAILLVEHDMDTVFAISDVITVLLEGRMLASGTPAEIRSNQQVQQAYLGEEHLV